jgi:hypothetical protein
MTPDRTGGWRVEIVAITGSVGSKSPPVGDERHHPYFIAAESLGGRPATK